MSRTDVVVVGAGPVGLLTALELRDHGVEVRVVDRAHHRSTRSKATIIWPRQLELLDRSGVTKELTGRGHRIDRISFSNGRREIGSASLAGLRDTPHPYGLTVPQPVFEEVLEDALARRGVAVERGVVHESLEQDEHEVRSTLVGDDGTTEIVTSDWVVACDGAHSPLRSQLGIPFEDDNPPVTFAITDVEIDGPVPSDALGYYYSPAGALGLVPLGGKLFRIAIGVPPQTPETPSRELFQEALRRRTGFAAELGDLAWSATFTVRFRTASRFRQGRVFLAGDSAHIMSPAGGQGMNTGIQDAVNVAWRIAAARDSQEEAGAATVEPYETERHAHARRVTRLTAALTRVGLLRSPVARAGRDVLARCAGAAGLLDAVLGPQMGQLDTAYGPQEGRPGRGAEAGARFPGTFDPDTAGFPVLATTGHTIVVWPGRSGSASDEWAQTAERTLHDAASPGVHVVVADPARLRSGVVRRLRRSPAVYVVRPDGHVAAVTPTAGAARRHTTGTSPSSAERTTV